MSTVPKRVVEPDLVESIARGYDAQALFERDGVLDRLRAALIEKFATQRSLALAAGGATQQTVVDGHNTSLLLGRLADLRDRVIAMHSRGHSATDIQKRASILLGENVSQDAIEGILSDVRTEAHAWRERALDTSYPIIIFESFRVKWRDAGGAHAKACHFAIGFQTRGTKEVLGIWFEDREPKLFWREVFSDLQARGVFDILYVVGATQHVLEAEAQEFHPIAVVRNPCELIRQSLDLATAKDRSGVQKALRGIHSATSEGDAIASLDRFEKDSLGQRYPAIAPMWRRHWPDVAPFFRIPLELRRVMTSIYAADGLRRGFQRALRAHGHMTSGEEASALTYLAVREALGKWRRPQREWHAAKTQLAMMFPDRFVP